MIKELIAKGRVAEAIELLPDEWPIVLGQRWSQFERNRRMGLLSYDQENLDRNRIINSIFEIIKNEPAVVNNTVINNTVNSTTIIISTPYDKELSEYVPKTDDSSIQLIQDIFKLKLQYFVLAAEFDTVFPNLAKEAMEVYDELKVMAGSVVISTDLNELDNIRESLPEFQSSIIGFKERAAKELRKANNSENSRVLTLLKADLPTFKSFQEAYNVLKEMKRSDRVEMPASLPKNDVLIRVLKKKFINAVK